MRFLDVAGHYLDVINDAALAKTLDGFRSCFAQFDRIPFAIKAAAGLAETIQGRGFIDEVAFKAERGNAVDHLRDTLHAFGIVIASSRKVRAVFSDLMTARIFQQELARS